MNHLFQRRLTIGTLMLSLLPMAMALAAEPTNITKPQPATKPKITWNIAADEKRKAAMSPEELAWEKVLEENLGSFYLPGYKRDKLAGKITAWDYLKDEPNLPRVLIIGDSVSRGYTLAVRKALQGKANVHRAPENCGGTGNGIKKLPVCLAGGKWDVIHFNFGLHDGGTPVADYEQRLDTIAKALTATGAKVIWASTTPRPATATEAERKGLVQRNEIAARVMQKYGIAIDDLYAFVLPDQAKYQNPKDVHFNADGYEALGKKVADAIAAALPQPK